MLWYFNCLALLLALVGLDYDDFISLLCFGHGLLSFPPPCGVDLLTPELTACRRFA